METIGSLDALSVGTNDRTVCGSSRHNDKTVKTVLDDQDNRRAILFSESMSGWATE